MTLADYPLLADANIHPGVVEHLRSKGLDVQTVAEMGLGREPDDVILEAALAAGRVVLTHDGDFGTLAVLEGKPFVGIVYLRPGHIRPAFTRETLDAIFRQQLLLTPPFILVARRAGDRVHLRIRRPIPE